MQLHLQNGMDYVVLFFIAVLVLIGIFQLYFWCQQNYKRKPIQLECFVDHWFDLKPGWIWVYNGFYYLVVLGMIFTFHDMRQFNYACFSFFILFLLHMGFFIYLPVETPVSWREKLTGNSITHKHLRSLYNMDKRSNCFPSMHMSVSTLAAMHFQANNPELGSYVYLFPLCIGFSALYIKQHFFLDLIPGVLLGIGAFKIYTLIYI